MKNEKNPESRFVWACLLSRKAHLVERGVEGALSTGSACGCASVGEANASDASWSLLDFQEVAALLPEERCHHCTHLWNKLRQEEKPPFKAGDRVRVKYRPAKQVPPWVKGMDATVGKEGVVWMVYKKGALGVDFDNGDRFVYAPDVLELITEPYKHVKAYDDSQLHRVWTKAVGTPGYDKAEWEELRKLVERGLVAEQKLKSGLMPENVGAAAEILADAFAASSTPDEGKVQPCPEHLLDLVKARAYVIVTSVEPEIPGGVTIHSNSNGALTPAEYISIAKVLLCKAAQLQSEGIERILRERYTKTFDTCLKEACQVGAQAPIPKPE